jgi:ribonuclease BN (tRNA processing enzyme)
MTDKERTGITTQATQGHLSPENVGKMAARAGAKTVVLTHLTFTPNETDYAAWADEVRKYFSGRVVVADDLMEF